MQVLIYGSGTMGKGIAQFFAQNNHQVLLYNPNMDSAINAFKTIKQKFEYLVQKNRLTEALLNTYLSNITVIDHLSKAKDVQLVIEAVSENMAIKKEVFSSLDAIINKEATFASNTSSLSITELALATKRPEKVIGMHFFNPVSVMNLVEVVKGMTTSQETIEAAVELSKELNKKPVVVEEAPGFIVNRMLIPMINEAVAIFSEGVATVEGIDEAMKNGANHPIGPLALADLIGLDVCLNIMDILHVEFGLDKYSAHPLLRKMVRANKLGRKTKVGFYQY